MEKLTHMISDRVREKKWRSFKTDQRGPIISHMMFADDLVLFAEASVPKIKNIIECLQVFGVISGHKISQEKSYIYFSPNVAPSIRREICSKSNFSQVEELGRYLGANISFPKKWKNKFKSIIEKVEKKLTGWQASSLSLVGRVTLVKSVTSAMALYPMQHDKVPTGKIDEVEKIQRNFIWGDTKEIKKRHAMALQQLYRPKAEGGLAIKNLRAMNEAFFMKLIWKMNVQPNDLWIQVLKGKYGRNEDWRLHLEAKSEYSYLWREMSKLGDRFRNNVETRHQIEGSSDLIWKGTGNDSFTVASEC